MLRASLPCQEVSWAPRARQHKVHQPPWQDSARHQKVHIPMRMAATAGSKSVCEVPRFPPQEILRHHRPHWERWADYLVRAVQCAQGIVCGSHTTGWRECDSSMGPPRLGTEYVRRASRSVGQPAWPLIRTASALASTIVRDVTVHLLLSVA